MTHLRATTHLADGANQLFEQWMVELRESGIDIDSTPGDDTALDADVVFACGLLTAVRQAEGQPVTIIAAPIFPGETKPVYRSVLIARADSGVAELAAGAGLRLAVNEYDSWSGWHGLKAHLRENAVPVSSIGSHVLTGGHMNSIDAVLDGRADIASIDHSVWHARCEADPATRRLQVIETTEDWPAPPISIRSTLSENVQHDLTRAVLALPKVRPASESDYAFMLAEAEEHPTWP